MKLVRILVVAIASIIGLLVVGALLLVWFFDPNAYKPYITAWLEERTGRSVAIEDDLELSFFPWLAVETGGIAIGNARGFEQRPFATIDRVSARVRLVPLLKRQLDVGTIRIDGLELELARTADGRDNWADLAAAAEQPSGNPASTTTANSGGLDIEGIDLRGARIVWRDGGDEPTYVVSELALSTDSISPTRPVPIELEFALLDVATQMTANLRAEGVVTIETPAGLTIEDLESSFTLTDGQQRERTSGNLELLSLTLADDGTLTSRDLDLSGRLFGAPVGPQDLPVALHWDAAGGNSATLEFSVSGLTTNLGGIAASWQVAGESLADAPVLRGSVTIADGSVASLLDLLSLDPPAGVTGDQLGEFAASARFVTDIAARTVDLTNVDIGVLGINLRASRAAVSDDSMMADIGIAPFRPNETVRSILRANLPAEFGVEPIERIAFSGNVATDLASGRTRLEDIRASLFGAELTGNLVWTQTAGDSALAGTISTNRFDPSEFLAVFDAWLTDTVDADELGPLMVATRFDYAAGTGAATLRELRLEAFGLTATGALDVRNAANGPVLTGEAHVDEFRPRLLFDRFGQVPPQTSDDTALRSARIDTEFSITSQLGRFSNLTVKLDDSLISGSFSVDEFANPSYRFELTADSLDADRYLPPQADQAEDGERRAGDIEISAAPLSSLVINGRASVGRLRLAQMDYQNVATNISVGGGRLALEGAHAELYGGAFDGSFIADATQDDASLALQGRAAGVALEPLIRALTGDASFSGTADFDIDLTGHGATITDNLHTAAGSMGFALRDGAIEGFNVQHKLCGYYNYLRQLPAPDPNQPERTSYDYIQGTSTVSEGIASSNDLMVRATNIDIRGTGRLSLAEQVADYAFEARFTDSVPIRGCESMDRLVGIDFPVTMTGPVTSPNIAPDYGEIFARWARDEVQDRVRERLQDRLLDRLR